MFHTKSNDTNFKYLSPWRPDDNESTCPTIQVVTCFIQCEDKFLVLQRARKDVQHKLWGIPGGKLDADEVPLKGLKRELKEETGMNLLCKNFNLIGTALSHTPSDGLYGLYIYHAYIANKINIKINLDEHYAFKWVSLKEFESLELLTAQREAYFFVKNKLVKFLKK